MARGCPRHSPLKRSAGRRRSPTGCAGAARGEQVEGSIDPRCETVRGTQWPLKVAGVFGTRVAESHLGQRSKRPHQQAGHMDASDPIRPRKLLWHGGRPHMGPGVRRDDSREAGTTHGKGGPLMELNSAIVGLLKMSVRSDRMAAFSQEQIIKFIRGISIRQIRLACGLVLFAYLVSHFLNHALGNISMDALATGVYYHNAFWQFLPVAVVFC